MSKNKIDSRYSLQSFDGILHVVEDTLHRYKNGSIDKNDVSTISSLLTVARQTISDKSRYGKPKNPVVAMSQPSTSLTSSGPFGVLRGGKSG